MPALIIFVIIVLKGMRQEQHWENEALGSWASTNRNDLKKLSNYLASLDLVCLCRDLGFGLEILGSFSAIQLYDSSLQMGTRGT